MIASGKSNQESLREAPITVLLRDLMVLPVLVDGRNLYDPGAARQAGFEYFSPGRDGATNLALQSPVKTRVA
jgi:hypothetical protein